MGEWCHRSAESRGGAGAGGRSWREPRGREGGSCCQSQPWRGGNKELLGTTGHGGSQEPPGATSCGGSKEWLGAAGRRGSETPPGAISRGGSEEPSGTTCSMPPPLCASPAVYHGRSEQRLLCTAASLCATPSVPRPLQVLPAPYHSCSEHHPLHTTVSAACSIQRPFCAPSPPCHGHSEQRPLPTMATTCHREQCLRPTTATLSCARFVPQLP